MFWHDVSTLANHSHILMTVSAMYDPAVCVTDQQYFKKHKESFKVQAEVEKLYLYLIGRCPSNDQQILYIEERIKDILDKAEKLFHLVVFSTKMLCPFSKKLSCTAV